MHFSRSDLDHREAYLPLGPNYSFRFVEREDVQQAADRSMLLNLQVSSSKLVHMYVYDVHRGITHVIVFTFLLYGFSLFHDHEGVCGFG